MAGGEVATRRLTRSQTKVIKDEDPGKENLDTVSKTCRDKNTLKRAALEPAGKTNRQSKRCAVDAKQGDQEPANLPTGTDSEISSETKLPQVQSSSSGNNSLKRGGKKPTIQTLLQPLRPQRVAKAKASTGISRASKEASDEEFQSPRKPVAVVRRGRPSAPQGPTKAEKEAAAAELPVITEPQAMFADMVRRSSEFQKFVGNFQRPLRVATMCSGTESPLLALEMLSKACKDERQLGFQIEHVFSCEIQDYKQGYIERNFAPPILFRDIRELGGEKAFTAYGALVDVPGDVDLLVAGTSCVDYSNLNNKKQDIDAKGESGQTFRGMMQWVENHRPPIVILENVCSAPWPKVQAYFEKKSYVARFMRLDTKQYYIPHTRTRVYLVAFDGKKCPEAAGMAESWQRLVRSMERPSSSTLEAFLLPTDDPRVHQGRERLAIPKERGIAGTDWGRCESRHQRARMDEALGTKRPYTSWEAQGVCKMPDYAWNDWAKVQTERVLDLMDINYLRLASKDTDPAYKTLVWNLSQNVDRTTGSVRPGICPCLTPTMVPFVTNRGGPLIGLEALSLQGIPVDDLMLTRQTEDQLADLAGNAMTSTVVGTCMMAALIASMDSNLLPARRNDVKRRQIPAERKLKVTGDETLGAEKLQLSSVKEVSLMQILEEASRSAQHCTCEGREGTSRSIRKCIDCGSTACQKCGGRPEHNYEAGLVARICPQNFSTTLKSALPMRVTLSGLAADSIESLKPNGIDGSLWQMWLEAIGRLDNAQFCFQSVHRGAIWTANYTSPSDSDLTLELVLDPVCPRWQVHVKPPRQRSPLQDALLMPVLRCLLNRGGSLLGDGFQVLIPNRRTIQVRIQGKGELVDTWQASLGIENGCREARRWSHWQVEVPREGACDLEHDVSGTYQLLQKCGHAANSLHKRVDGPAESPDVFLFLDPSRCGGPETDRFTFATAHRRLSYKQHRCPIAVLDPTWRPHGSHEPSEVAMEVFGTWKPIKGLGIGSLPTSDAKICKPVSELGLDLSDEACGSAVTVLNCKVPLTAEDGHLWKDNWTCINLERSKALFDRFAWLTERLQLPDILQRWNGPPGTRHKISGCACCAPPQPGMEWVYCDGRLSAREDPQQAADYEFRIKARPPPFVVRFRRDRESAGEFQVAVNSRTLVNRALAELPHSEGDDLSVSWRLVEHGPAAAAAMPGFSLTSNRGDQPPDQPPDFKGFPLRPEQLRSLGWMLKQEATEDPFVEEEVSEAVLPALRWRAEGRAQKRSMVRGGVLADQVGYGKTAVIVGLIDCKKGAAVASSDAAGGSIPLKATLVLVPPHLANQWPSEIQKFTGSALKVEVVKTVGDLNRLSILDLQDADVVVVASSVLRSQRYYERLAQFSGSGEGLVRAKTASHFAECYASAMEGVSAQAQSLKEGNTGKLWERVKEANAKLLEQAKCFDRAVRRLKGKQLLDATEKAENAASTADPTVQVASDGGEANDAEGPKKRACRAQDPQSSPEAGAPVSVRNAKPQRGRSGGAKAGSKLEQRLKREVADLQDSGKESGGDTSDSHHSDQTVSHKARVPPNRDQAGLRRSGRKRSAPVPIYQPPSQKSDGSAAASDDSDSEHEEDEEFKVQVNEPDPHSDSEPDEEESPRKRPRGTAVKKADPDNGGIHELHDLWGLTSEAVQEDWREMLSPPLEMFQWARLVVDEFTYLKHHDKIAIQHGLKASCRWVLSGTPPHESFDDVKGIAAFLNIHLGCNDGTPMFTKKEQTKAQTFQFYRDFHTQAWHERRHRIAQSFLDRFVRQNIAEIDEIEQERHVNAVQLVPVEKAIYLELDHHLQALDMKSGRRKMWNRKGAGGDRAERLKAALGSSESPEEALLKRCSHFDLNSSAASALQACKDIVELRKQQLNECKAELISGISKGWAILSAIQSKNPDFVSSKEDGAESVSFLRWIGLVKSGAASEDLEATDLLRECVSQAGRGSQCDSAGRKRKNGDLDVDGMPLKVSAADDLEWSLREHTHALRRLDKELVGRVRSLRYFQAILQLSDSANGGISCCRCGSAAVAVEHQAVLSSCGHTGCLSCLTEAASQQECIVAGCKAAVRLSSVVERSQLGTHMDEMQSGGRFGSKIQDLVRAIKATEPSDRVLVFVQFKDLMQTVSDALESSNIRALQLRGTSHQKSNGLESFQRETFNKGDPKVLLLNVKDESASGANLTTANHAFFVHPLLVTSHQEYHACLTQAIGRVVRYGQNKKVHIRHFLAANTIDMEIHTERHGSELLNGIAGDDGKKPNSEKCEA